VASLFKHNEDPFLNVNWTCLTVYSRSHQRTSTALFTCVPASVRFVPNYEKYVPALDSWWIDHPPSMVYPAPVKFGIILKTFSPRATV